MKKTLMEFIEENFEALDGTTDDLGNAIDVWSQDGDTLLFSITNYGENEDYTVLLWHDDNNSLRNEVEYFAPTEKELIEAVNEILEKYNKAIDNEN